MEPRVVGILATVGVYIAGCIYVGIRGMRGATGTMEDHFLGGRSFGVILMVFTIYATMQSAYMYIGAPGFVYSNGVGIWYSNLSNVLWGPTFLLLAIPLWRIAKRFKYISQSDFLIHRFDSKPLGIIVALWMLLGNLPAIGAQTIAVCVTLETLTNGAVPFWLGAIIFLGTIGIYSSLGGARGVVWTDLFQGILMLVCIWSGLAYLLPRVGGTASMFSQLAVKFPKMMTLPGLTGLLTPMMWFGYIFADVCGMSVSLHNFARYYMAKSWKALALSAFLVPIGTTLTFYAASMYGFSAKILYPSLAKGDMAMPKLILEALPAWIGALLVTGMFAASMSTLDSLTLSMAASWAKDVHGRLNPAASQATLMSVGRAFTWVILIGGAIVGYVWQGTQGLVLLSFLGTSLKAILYPVIVGGVFWRRATKEGAIAGCLVGMVVAVKMLLIGPKFDPWINLYGGVWAMLTTLVVMVAVSLATKPTPKHILDEIREALMVPRRKVSQPGTVRVPAD